MDGRNASGSTTCIPDNGIDGQWREDQKASARNLPSEESEYNIIWDYSPSLEISVKEHNLSCKMAPNNNLETVASIDAQMRLLVQGKVSEDDKLIEYDALLLDRFLDIVQDLHGEEIKEQTFENGSTEKA